MTLNLAPMVDVMMCLIIFFLLASRLVDESHRPVALPTAEAARETDAEQAGSRVVLNIRPASREAGTAGAAGGAGISTAEAEYVVADFDGSHIVERRLAVEELPTYLQAHAGRAADRAEELRCVIRADKAVTYASVEAALRAAGLAKISKVSFGAVAGIEEEGP
jgi:biopolymer transport protein ExbD